MRFATSFVVLIILTIAVQPARAWNKAGHMLTGAIAYQVLKQDDARTIARTVALLRQHPDFDRWLKLKHDPAERDQFLFTQAARWPDDARDDPTFYPPDAHYDKLHYINLPYKPKGQPDSVKTAPPDDLNIFRGYQDKLAILKAKGDGSKRAVALCWVAHLVGDVHQPLHTASLFSTKFPRGDRGGTLFNIRASDGKFPISLHKYWDDLLLSSENFTMVRNYATELRLRKNFAKDQLHELADADFQHWAVKESFELAKDAVYRAGKLEGGAQKNQAPTLPADYAKTVQPIAERRAVLAGYRLAVVLKKALE